MATRPHASLAGLQPRGDMRERHAQARTCRSGQRVPHKPLGLIVVPRQAVVMGHQRLQALVGRCSAIQIAAGRGCLRRTRYRYKVFGKSVCLKLHTEAWHQSQRQVSACKGAMQRKTACLRQAGAHALCSHRVGRAAPGYCGHPGWPCGALLGRARQLRQLCLHSPACWRKPGTHTRQHS